MAFQPASFLSRRSTSLNVALDPTVGTKKEFEDVCGVQFDHESLEKRLERTSFLYPKHVEVIEDIAPIADKMVDDIVSSVMIDFYVICCSLVVERRLQCKSPPFVS
jgi:hypothetical protein